MGGVLAEFAARRGAPLLLAVAAPAEARAALGALRADEALAERAWSAHAVRPDLHLIVTGVGKVNVAGAVAIALSGGRYAGVVSAGIAGRLPGSTLELGAVVAASASVYADEGLQTPTGFLEVAAIGFPIGPFEGNRVEPHPELRTALRSLADALLPIATVSTCSGTDALASQVAQRTGAAAEAMEGAAVGHVAARLGVAFGEIRVISNTTGDRPRQRWDLKGSLARLGQVISRC